MYPILQQLYNGNIAPYKAPHLPTDDLAAQDEFLHFHNNLEQPLQTKAPELEKKCSYILSEIHRVYLDHTEEMFYQGFSLATKLLTEALAYEQ